MPMDYYAQWATVSAGIRQGLVTTGEYDAVLSRINSAQITPQEFLNISKEIPDVLNVYNKNGEVIQTVYKDTRSFYNGGTVGYDNIPTLSQQINSNVASGGTAVAEKTTTVKKVINVTTDAQTGKTVLSKEFKLYKDNTPTVTQGFASSALAGVAAASVGITLGKNIDAALYNFNPEMWDSLGMQELNPETWSSITEGDDSLGASLFNFVFKIDPNTGNPQAYLDQNAVAYLTAYMASQGFFSGGTSGYVPTSSQESVIEQYHPSLPIVEFPDGGHYTFATDRVVDVLSDDVKVFIDYTNQCRLHVCSKNYHDEVVVRITDTTGAFGDDTMTCTQALSIGGETYYTNYENVGVDEASVIGYINTGESNITGVAAFLLLFGEYYQGSVPGVTDQTGSTQFDDSSISDYSDIASVLALLMTQFPDLWANRIEFSTDGVNTKTYLPVGFPTGGTGTDNQTTTNGATQSDTEPKIAEEGSNVTDELIKTIIEMITGDKTDIDTDTDTPADVPQRPADDYDIGGGDTPVIIDPTGSASALWKIYNPDQAAVDAFGAWLWSPSFVDQLLKLFNDPMQAIIGLHKIFVTPPTSGSGPIKVGYLSSGVNADYVSDQYTEIDCGSVNLMEFYGNVLDYDPYTRIILFLPFIGFVDLSNSDCMRGRISIKYKVDVLTGCCLALVSVERDLYDVVKYQFAGNCAVQYPVSSGSYIGMVTGLLGMAGGIAGTVLSGGALAPALMGVGASIGAMHTNVSHSGNISANAGAMGCKIPYIMIERPQTKTLNKPDVEGLPDNKYMKLSSAHGFVRVKKAIYNGLSAASQAELTLIRSLLETGVYL